MTRVTLPGVKRAGSGFGLQFEGRTIRAFPGETLAAALLSAGEPALRHTASGDPRGLWCGMGVCGECTMLVDGVARRTCMTPVAPGQRVEPLPALTHATPQSTQPMCHHRCDLLVIGGGPAGLAATLAARAAGLSVILIDERAKPGGQYFKQPGTGMAIDAEQLDAQFAAGRTLISSVVASGALLWPESLAWHAALDGDDVQVAVTTPDGPAQVRARRLVVATGAMERAWPVPGWTLPGVMTTGAAQTLLRGSANAPGRRVLVAGNGPLNLQLACELLAAGITVVAVVEQAPRPGIMHIAALANMLASHAGLAATGAAQLTKLVRAGVPLLFGHVVTRISGSDRAERVAVAPASGGAERWFDVDALCIGAGFQPQAELARALGCALADDGQAVARDDTGRTSQPCVFVAGDGGGLGGAVAAQAQGWLAGAAAARDLIGALPPPLARQDAQARRDMARARRFQRGLWQMFAPAGPATPPSTPDTLACRCEGVTMAGIDTLIAAGETDIGAIKRATRLGMGRCQGRYCAPLLAARLGHAGLFAPRPPFKPVTIAAIAARDDG
jgi:NADPH-dependent 2,4-dienoyl-CoA reductase/sulfur reductase-like enzyme